MPNEETVNKIKKSQVADNKSADIIFMTKVKPPQIEHQEIINNENEMKESNNKMEKFLKSLIKPIGLIACLYFFICSLDTMSSSFRLIAGKYASELFRKSDLITNPLAGLMIGVLVTVFVQSSSTSTSIVVSMVAAEIIEVKFAIPIIMGANIGTSITSALVSLGQVAFAGATVHDMFNCLTVLVLLPIEVTTGYLNFVTKKLVDALIDYDINAKEPELLTALTKPLTSLIIQLDKEVLKSISIGKVNEEVDLRKHVCRNESILVGNETVDYKIEKCSYLLESLKWPEWAIGILLLICSLSVLIICLLFMVKILNSVFQGPVAKLLQKIVNSDLPGVFRHFTSFVAMMLGCILTIVIQSSSVFMSTLTPLVGLGLVSIERVFPLTLGANIGTTVTGILAAFSASPSSIKYSLQIAFCHSLFNITGILIWYPIPYLRNVPLGIARWLGNTTSKYRWFVIVYLSNVFLILPLTIFGLSLAGKKVMFTILTPIIIFLVSILLINVLQNKSPNILPDFLKDWMFLPEHLRSLEPYDKLIIKCLMCCKCCKLKLIDNVDNCEEAKNEKGDSNKEIIYEVHTNVAFTTNL